ncbi:hypothetical protein B0I35DRAFT_443939 [Stachybotrys elegans]|uniref:Tyrosinase copper-binding domain-containing protein n=1 Tax=Stachybotrys elegans TaxID=80388 RepID=A0A8K0WKB2_9HYPO|nr:hypothetical protein B0I35DRAFT_443939 [Stachybotrys elegans]
MVRLSWIPFVFASLSVAVETTQHSTREAACTVKVQHKPWQMLTSAERTAYINAELCLMEAPTRLNVAGSKTLWDDLQWAHILQANVMHDVGHFLPWHRYFFVVHGNLLREECGYTGPLPYWDETADASLSDLSRSPVFQNTAFGGTGSGAQSYITTGPFASLALRMRRPGQSASNYRISRSLNVRSLASARQASLDACFQMTTYTAAWECWGGSPHGAGHGATGGLMVDVFASPGDPVFYLHHGWLDAMWWKWQTLDLPGRLTDMGGRNVPRLSYVQRLGTGLPGREWTDYHGERGNITTLNHILSVNELAPNVTVGNVMDVGGSVVCADYIFSNSFNATINTIVDGFMTTFTE